jgi:hypothetical protein
MESILSCPASAKRTGIHSVKETLDLNEMDSPRGATPLGQGMTSVSV